ncbi:MAG TPA: acyl carrier protein [Pseudonocardiaceae bacterium]|nr:acyl carrier protein [Pseudonocardiaceae bacterium]
MTQEKLHEIWSQKLKLDEFSNEDDFFALGGHSLIMAQIQEAIAKEFGIEVPMDELFRRPTVSAIQAHLESQLARS